MKKRNEIKEMLEKFPQYREKLFFKGFIFSTQSIISTEYPFYGEWSYKTTRNGSLLCHKDQKFYLQSFENYELLLIGHAYNPFTGEYEETEILKNLDKHRNSFFDYFNQLTGIFTLLVITKNKLWILGDPAGMQSTFYMNKNGNVYISTHEHLIGDVLGLERSDYVNRLSSYKFYPLLGNSLPGDITQFNDVIRVIPNHYVEIANNLTTVSRFFTPQKLELSTTEIAKRVANILSNNISLISKKWAKPAISLTGGCDSKTTLACAADFYDRFQYFSYISSDEERVDADAAHEICKELDLKHTNYEIPMSDDEYSDIEIHRTLQYWNTGALTKNNSNDVRKRIFFSKLDDFDVEIKSWVSEVGRAYYSKRFNGRKKFGKITPRKCTTMYKFFLHNRKLVRQTDRIFKAYIDKYLTLPKEAMIDWQDLLFWEFRMSSWNGLVITGGRYSYDIAIPYNNRLLIESLLSASLADKINDEVYRQIRLLMNAKIEETGISVVNIKHTKRRAKFENLYYAIHSKFPL